MPRLLVSAGLGVFLMRGVSKAAALIILREAIAVCEDKIHGSGTSHVARGLAPEGFDGGYQMALMDVDALLRHGFPSDHRGIFRQAAKQLKQRAGVE